MLDAVRTSEEGPSLSPERLRAEPPVEQLMQSVEAAMRDALEGRTIRDLVLSRDSSTSG